MDILHVITFVLFNHRLPDYIQLTTLYFFKVETE